MGNISDALRRAQEEREALRQRRLQEEAAAVPPGPVATAAGGSLPLWIAHRAYHSRSAGARKAMGQQPVAQIPRRASTQPKAARKALAH